MDTRHMLVLGGNSICSDKCLLFSESSSCPSWMFMVANQLSSTRNIQKLITLSCYTKETETIKLLDWKAKVTVEEFLCGCRETQRLRESRSECFHGSFRHWKFIYSFWCGKDLPRWVEHHEGQIKELVRAFENSCWHVVMESFNLCMWLVRSLTSRFQSIHSLNLFLVSLLLIRKKTSTFLTFNDFQQRCEHVQTMTTSRGFPQISLSWVR